MNPTNHDLNTLTLTHHYQNKPKNSDILLQVHSINVKAIIHNSPHRKPKLSHVSIYSLYNIVNQKAKLKPRQSKYWAWIPKKKVHKL